MHPVFMQVRKGQQQWLHRQARLLFHACLHYSELFRNTGRVCRLFTTLRNQKVEPDLPLNSYAFITLHKHSIIFLNQVTKKEEEFFNML